MGIHKMAIAVPEPQYHSHSDCFVQGIPTVDAKLREEHPEAFTSDQVVVKYYCVEKPVEVEMKKPAQGGL